MCQVYILRSTIRRWYYVGSTNRLLERVSEHNNRKVPSTKHLVPLQLVFTKEFATEKEARAYEQKLKRKRREKESIIRTIESYNN